MITLTNQVGKKLKIDEKLIIRARRTVYGESKKAKTRIDWAIKNFVLEPIDKVADLIAKKKNSFVFLTARDGDKIWFDAKKVVGPLPITESQMRFGYKSSIKLMNYRQYVVETEAQVRKTIKDAGGKPIP